MRENRTWLCLKLQTEPFTVWEKSHQQTTFMGLQSPNGACAPVAVLCSEVRACDSFLILSLGRVFCLPFETMWVVYQQEFYFLQNIVIKKQAWDLLRLSPRPRISNSERLSGPLTSPVPGKCREARPSEIPLRSCLETFHPQDWRRCSG